MMFDDLAKSTDKQHRGYLLQELLNQVFTLHEIPVMKSFTRNEGGEQIDGAFRFEGWLYLVDFLLAKIANLNLKAEPYYGVTQYIEEHQG